MSTATSTTTVPTGCANRYDTPIQGVGCAMVFENSYIDMMAKCCKGANVISYYHDCGLFCLAMDQTVKDLYECLYDEGAKYEDVFCGSNNTTASATATEQASIPASAEATIISAGSGKDEKDRNGGDESKTGSTSRPTNSGNAGPEMKPQSGISTLGLTIGALLVSSMLFGALQV